MYNNICRGYEVRSRAGHNTGLLKKIHYNLKRNFVAIAQGSRFVAGIGLLPGHLREICAGQKGNEIDLSPSI
jgi:hypothetical protein